MFCLGWRCGLEIGWFVRSSLSRSVVSLFVRQFVGSVVKVQVVRKGRRLPSPPNGDVLRSGFGALSIS